MHSKCIFEWLKYSKKNYQKGCMICRESIEYFF